MSAATPGNTSSSLSSAARLVTQWDSEIFIGEPVCLLFVFFLCFAFVCFVSRWELTMPSCMAWNFLWKPGWLFNSERSSCVCFSRDGIKGLCHCSWFFCFLSFLCFALRWLHCCQSPNSQSFCLRHLCAGFVGSSNVLSYI